MKRQTKRLGAFWAALGTFAAFAFSAASASAQMEMGMGMGMGPAPDFYSRQAESSPESKFFAENQTAFALKLYRGATEGAKTDANVLVAPFSVFRGLNALSLGSAGKTKAEIDAALGRSDVADETWIRTLAAVDSSLNAAPETTFAGALWFAPDLKLDETFVQRCKETSRIEAAAFDFAAPNALKKANAWFARNTGRKIRNFLTELNPETGLLIADATTFKATWRIEFELEKTQTRFFTDVRGEKIPVATMRETAPFKYCDAENFQYLEAPYKGGRFAFVVVLPREGESFVDVERSLTPELLRECRERAEQTTVALRLPRFKVERSFDLAATLKKAGVVSAFGPDADLSPITGGGEPLKVDQAKQAAFISVNEKGTEAGAATMQAAMMGAAIPNVEFYADRPFVYFIRDNATGAVLFAGRLVAPEPDGKTADAEYWEKEDQEEKERKAKELSERRERLF